MRRPPHSLKCDEAPDDIAGAPGDHRHSEPSGHGDGLAASPRSSRLSDQLVQEAQTLFERRTGRSFSLEDARQILENLTGFFCALRRWTRTPATPGADVQPPNP
jgi:hypothetical protein